MFSILSFKQCCFRLFLNLRFKNIKILKCESCENREVVALASYLLKGIGKNIKCEGCYRKSKFHRTEVALGSHSKLLKKSLIKNC